MIPLIFFGILTIFFGILTLMIAPSSLGLTYRQHKQSEQDRQDGCRFHSSPDPLPDDWREQWEDRLQ